jgi:Domain of unknown function (DUF5659)
MIEVSDMWVAAYVAASGVRLIETRRTEDDWMVFVFEPPARQAIERWNSGKAMIDARAYRATVRHYKDIIYRTA